MILICLIISVFVAYMFSELGRYSFSKNVKIAGNFFAFLTCIMFAVTIVYILCLKTSTT